MQLYIMNVQIVGIAENLLISQGKARVLKSRKEQDTFLFFRPLRENVVAVN